MCPWVWSTNLVHSLSSMVRGSYGSDGSSWRMYVCICVWISNTTHYSNFFRIVFFVYAHCISKFMSNVCIPKWYGVQGVLSSFKRSSSIIGVCCTHSHTNTYIHTHKRKYKFGERRYTQWEGAIDVTRLTKSGKKSRWKKCALLVIEKSERYCII